MHYLPFGARLNKGILMVTQLIKVFSTAGGGGRTRTVLPPTDFESVSSANSNTPARCYRYILS